MCDVLGLVSFAPEHFAVPRLADRSRAKQFQRALRQLQAEGVVQVLHSAGVLAVVGPLQFDVAAPAQHLAARQLHEQ